MFVAFQRFVDRIEKHFVGDISNRLARLVQIGEDPRALLFDQITDDFVVEIIDLNMRRMKKWNV